MKTNWLIMLIIYTGKTIFYEILQEMAQNSSGSYRVPPDVYSFTQEGSTVSQEVSDDDEMSTTSSTTNDTGLVNKL